MRFSALSDAGKVRDLNEDSFALPLRSDIPVFVLADGMGGHLAGEVASANAAKLVFDYVCERYKSVKTNKELTDVMKTAIEKANEKIYEMSVGDEKYDGMGTTLDLCVVRGETAFIAHVGDSRVYKIRGDRIIQMTFDHSLVAMLVKNGTITESEARTHPQRNVITRAVGSEPAIEADVFSTSFKEGDALVMCSDGLSNMLKDKDIFNIVRSFERAGNAVRALVGAANQKGGTDNITVILIKR